VTPFSYSDSPYPIRADLSEAHRWYWDRLARPGAWWTGAERVAIASELRRAPQCRLCIERKAALSPGMVEGAHDGDDLLPSPAVDAIHRIVTDASRLSKTWLEKLYASGVSDGHYVELVGVVVAVVSIDAFHHNLGLAIEPLPEPVTGEATGYRPASTVQGPAWVPWIPGNRASGLEADLYPNASQAPNVYLAMSLVPDAVRAMGRLSQAQYISPAIVAAPGRNEPGRAIDRSQIELIAGRVSALNECFY
jgi:hypothetical protein